MKCPVNNDSSPVILPFENREMKNIYRISIIAFFVITACSKTEENNNSAAFEAVINGTSWKADSAKAIYNQASNNYFITGYTNTGTAIYLITQADSVSNYQFRQQSVLFTSFNVTTNRKTSNKATLSWSTGSELNNDHFQVERSSDGLNWVALAQVKAAGNSNITTNYSYVDKPPLIDPFKGKVYYRINAIDKDQKSYYSLERIISSGWTAIIKHSDYAADYSYGNSGTLNITAIDMSKRVISGNFSFVYINDNTGLAERVENGHFNKIKF
jgi:hypothetical protein